MSAATTTPDPEKEDKRTIAEIAADLQEQKFTEGLRAELANSSVYAQALKIEDSTLKGIVQTSKDRLKKSEAALTTRTEAEVLNFQNKQKEYQAERTEKQEIRQGEREEKTRAKAKADEAGVEALGAEALGAKAPKTPNASLFATFASRMKSKPVAPFAPDNALIAMTALAGLQVNFLNSLQATKTI